MCTALFFYNVHPSVLFLLAFNREEYQARYVSNYLDSRCYNPQCYPSSRNSLEAQVCKDGIFKSPH